MESLTGNFQRGQFGASVKTGVHLSCGPMLQVCLRKEDNYSGANFDVTDSGAVAETAVRTKLAQTGVQLGLLVR